MKTIRRIYFYAVSLISIEVIIWGVINLLRSILDFGKITNDASTLARALALILVGVPIFLIHWFWAQHTSKQDNDERSSTVRAVFLYGILLGTLIPATQNLLALVNRSFLQAAGLFATQAVVGGTQTWLDNLIAILVNVLISGYFWNILKTEWRNISETENFIEIRRLYRFIWMLYGLLMVVFGTQQVISYAFTLATGNILGALGRETAFNGIALLTIGSPVWFFFWRTLQRALNDPGEKESMLRLGILYLLSLGSAIVTLTAGGNLVYRLMLQVLGKSVDFTEFIQVIGGPISIGAPFAVLWAYYGTWLNRQFLFDADNSRQASKKRLYFYILSLVGLAATIFAISSLLSVIIDLLFTTSYLSSEGFSSSVSSALGVLVAGLPLWLLTWRPMQSQASEESPLGEHARRSIIRKTYLYLVFFACVIGVMISGGLMIFTLINAALGGAQNVLKSVLNSLQLLACFSVVLAYHLSTLRKDSAAYKNTLDEKQRAYKLIIFHNDDDSFIQSIKISFEKLAHHIPLRTISLKEKIPTDLNAEAIVLPASLTINPPEEFAAWLRSFHGSRIIITDEQENTYWVNSYHQAAETTKDIAEGQKISGAPTGKKRFAWVYIAYVFAALFALQLLLMLISLGVSLVVD